MKLNNMKYLIGLLFITITYAENEIEKPPLKLNSTIVKETSSMVAEGGLTKTFVDAQPKGREGYTPAPANSSSSIIPVHELSNTTTPILNIYNSTVEKHRIAGKKGVSLTDTTSKNISEIPVRPKKPNVTEPGGNNSFAPSHFQLSDKLNSSSKIPKVPNPNIINDSSQDNTQKYIVPIVIVILSVPFVAILISVVYKRGAEWWKYRHYRRMDFLINGMYDH